MQGVSVWLGKTGQEWPLSRQDFTQPPLAKKYVCHRQPNYTKLHIRANLATDPSLMNKDQEGPRTTSNQNAQPKMKSALNHRERTATNAIAETLREHDFC